MLVCDEVIIGTETIHTLSKERLIIHQHRPSEKSYQDFNNGETLNLILVQQHSGDDIPESLLSLMTRKVDNDHFECCSEYFNSLDPFKNDTTGPPKDAIANQSAIDHLPLEWKIEGEATPRQSNIRNQDIIGIMQKGSSLPVLTWIDFCFHGWCSLFGDGSSKTVAKHY